MIVSADCTYILGYRIERRWHNDGRCEGEAFSPAGECVGMAEGPDILLVTDELRLQAEAHFRANC